MVRRRDAAGKWDAPVTIVDGSWDHYSPTIVARGNGAMAIWSGQAQSGFDLYAAEISPGGKASKVERLTRAPMSDFNARAVSDAAGAVTVVWQSFRSGNADIYARRLSGKSWGPETRVSTSDANDWEPAVALIPPAPRESPSDIRVGSSRIPSWNSSDSVRMSGAYIA